MLNVQKLNDDYTLVHHDHLLDYIRPGIVEEKYNAKFLGEFCCKNSQGWVNGPSQIYYTPERHPEGSNYFALWFKGDDLVISNGISAVENPDGTPVIYQGVLDEKSKEILYSAFRHDYQTYWKMMCDGGRDYLKSSTHPSVSFVIEKDSIKVLDKTT